MGSNTFSVKIDSLSYGGRGVGKREDGKVVFVPSVIPGERVRVHSYKEHSSYVLAGIDEVLEFSPYRVDPRCSLFPLCGGCDWQHIAYNQQVFWKQKILEDEIGKTCKVLPEIEQGPVQSDKMYGYRGHTVIQCRCDPEFSMGFFQKRSKRIVDFDHCPVLNPQIQKILAEIKEIFRRNPVHGIYSLEVHAPQDDIILLARCKGTTHKNDLKTMDRIYNELDVAGVSFVMFGARRSDHVLGQRFCRYEIHTPTSVVQLSSGFGGFIQANMGINTALVEYVMKLAQDSDTILDLYSGSGNFSIPVAQLVKEVVAIERNPRLASQGKINAKKNNAGNVRFLSLDVKKAVESIRKELLKFDTIILDPPRQGANEIMKTLHELDASRVIYISCNPSTLARDLKSLIDSGFSLKHARVFDMFPQTYHIESVSYLER